MSFIISRGYAEVQILKTKQKQKKKKKKKKKKKQVNLTLPAFETFCYASVKILKKVKLKRTLHIFICKKKSADTLRYHIFVCNIGSAI